MPYPIGRIRFIHPPAYTTKPVLPITPPGVVRLVGSTWVRIAPRLTYDASRPQPTADPLTASLYPVTNVADVLVTAMAAATGWYLPRQRATLNSYIPDSYIPNSYDRPRITAVDWPTDAEVDAIIATLHLPSE